MIKYYLSTAVGACASGSVCDASQIFVSCDFFRKPPQGFTIDWRAAKCNIPRNHQKPCHEKCMEGVVVKLAYPQRIWVLTGNAEHEIRGHVHHMLGYEAVWPD
jgi:hypothetical protein